MAAPSSVVPSDCDGPQGGRVGVNGEAIDGDASGSLYQQEVDSQARARSCARLLESGARQTYKSEASGSVDGDVLRRGSFHKHGGRRKLVEPGQRSVQGLAICTVDRDRFGVRENGDDENAQGANTSRILYFMWVSPEAQNPLSCEKTRRIDSL